MVAELEAKSSGCSWREANWWRHGMSSVGEREGARRVRDGMIGIWATRDLMASVRDGRGLRSSATGGERTAEAMDGEQNGEGRLEKGRGGKQRVARSRRGGEGRDAGGRKLETERSSGVGRGTYRCRWPFPHARRRRRAVVGQRARVELGALVARRRWDLHPTAALPCSAR